MIAARFIVCVFVAALVCVGIMAAFPPSVLPAWLLLAIVMGLGAVSGFVAAVWHEAAR